MYFLLVCVSKSSIQTTLTKPSRGALQRKGGCGVPPGSGAFLDRCAEMSRNFVEFSRDFLEMSRTFLEDYGNFLEISRNF